MDIVYRKAVNSDLDGINNLIGNVFNHHLDEDFLSDNYFSVVAVYDGKIVGHLFVTKIYNAISKKIWYKIDDVCVLDQFRGQHISKNLFKKLDEIAKEDKVSFYELTSNKKRVAAHGLYKSIGFNIIDTCLFRKEL